MQERPESCNIPTVDVFQQNRSENGFARWGLGVPSYAGDREHNETNPRFWTILDSIYARARVNVNLELSRSENGCQ